MHSLSVSLCCKPSGRRLRRQKALGVFTPADVEFAAAGPTVTTTKTRYPAAIMQLVAARRFSRAWGPPIRRRRSVQLPAMVFLQQAELCILEPLGLVQLFFAAGRASFCSWTNQSQFRGSWSTRG